MKKIVKRFLEWIKIKEKIHTEKSPPTFEEREIRWAILGENIGHEENGRGDDKKITKSGRQNRRRIIWGIEKGLR